jgi:hypothetical protein
MIRVEVTQEQTTTYSPEQVLAKGEGTVFKGAPNLGANTGPVTSPELGSALNQ